MSDPSPQKSVRHPGWEDRLVLGLGTVLLTMFVTWALAKAPAEFRKIGLFLPAIGLAYGYGVWRLFLGLGRVPGRWLAVTVGLLMGFAAIAAVGWIAGEWITDYRSQRTANIERLRSMGIPEEQLDEQPLTNPELFERFARFYFPARVSPLGIERFTPAVAFWIGEVILAMGAAGGWVWWSVSRDQRSQS